MPKKLTTEEFIQKAREVHGDKYDYSKVKYKSTHEKIIVICSEHGEFSIQPNSLLNGRGCQKCGNKNKGKEKKITTEEFIKRAREVHGCKYDYSKVKYNNEKDKVCIICPEHGEFWQKPVYHLLNKCDCPKCANKKNINIKSLTTEDFILRAREIHGWKYDYSKVNYINNRTKVCIICPEHGEFWMRPNCHLSKQGCPKCGKIEMSKKNTLTTEEFIQKAREVHGDKYDYSKVKYVNNYTKVCIICPEHGEFLIKPNSHLNGCGCHFCNETNGERKVRLLLEKRKINYEQEKTFDWLKNNGNLFLDFYLPDYNIAIEYQGIKHSQTTDFARKGKEWAMNMLSNTKDRDLIKKNLCEKYNIKLFYINYNDNIEKKISLIFENETTC